MGNKDSALEEVVSDPFDISRIDSVSGGGAARDSAPAPLTSQAARARLMEGVDVPDVAPAAHAPPGCDQVGFSHESEESGANRGAAMSSLLAAFSSPDTAQVPATSLPTPPWGLTQQSGPAPGFQAGFTMGTAGLHGLEPGMQPGAVFSSPVMRQG